MGVCVLVCLCVRVLVCWCVCVERWEMPCSAVFQEHMGYVVFYSVSGTPVFQEHQCFRNTSVPETVQNDASAVVEAGLAFLHVHELVDNGQE